MDTAINPSSGPLRLLVVHNPVSGWPGLGWRRVLLLNRVVALLRRAGAVVEIRRTAERGDAERFARAARGAGFDRLVVAGGDGTINEVANALAGSSLPLAIVPLGTANVLAAEIGLRMDAASVARAVLEGPAVPVSLGVATSARGGARRFVLMVGLGFDAQVVRQVHPAAKRLLGKPAYVLAMLRVLRRYRRRSYAIVADGRRYDAGSAILANGRRYGGKFVLAPEARLDSPTLELCLFRAADRRAILRYTLALALGRLHRLDDVTIVNACNVAVECADGADDGDMSLQGDGDLLGRLPARIAVQPRALLLAVPAGSPLAVAQAPARLAAAD